MAFKNQTQELPLTRLLKLSLKGLEFKKIFLPVLSLLFISTLSSCTYLKYNSIQAEYDQIQDANPSQVNLKHMIDRETFFVYGMTIDDTNRYQQATLAIAAYSNAFSQNERVDVMYMNGAGTHFGLNLPEGTYTLLVFSDINNNQLFESSEVIGQKEIILSNQLTPERVLGQVDVELTTSRQISWNESIPVVENHVLEQSIYYPSGTIRSLDDPIFNADIATLGMYDPASFLEQAPTMFYALEEDIAYKIPVIFVHGIDGTSRSFKSIIEGLDRDKYKPWFFYYPSGGDLDQLADFFYELFLSGEIVTLIEDMPVIVVAHSMGGLIVREAFNRYEGIEQENEIKLLVTLASPLGGHPGAALGEEHGLLVLPAWRDLNPTSRFMAELYRKPLPNFVNHQLLYAYDNESFLKFGENSDGVVPLSSQLHPQAQLESAEQFGFNSSHTGILENEDMIAYLLDKISNVESIFPDIHMALLINGGYDLNLGDSYNAESKFLIRTIGKYLVALSRGEIEPINSGLEQFQQAAKGESSPLNETQSDLIKIITEFL